jgi:hypothetical protein
MWEAAHRRPPQRRGAPRNRSSRRADSGAPGDMRRTVIGPRRTTTPRASYHRAPRTSHGGKRRPRPGLLDTQSSTVISDSPASSTCVRTGGCTNDDGHARSRAPCPPREPLKATLLLSRNTRRVVSASQLPISFCSRRDAAARSRHACRLTCFRSATSTSAVLGVRPARRGTQSAHAAGVANDERPAERRKHDSRDDGRAARVPPGAGAPGEGGKMLVAARKRVAADDRGAPSLVETLELIAPRRRGISRRPDEGT